ncbi:Vegetative incompatibility protein HET-E-1 [Fusarium oxysporum f. sp. cubense]|uniref:Vegetative incompatibility protein HET-E-1 n=1 Tax=Fusarium oxysporum f. sp. cubense TaxID=61366 RepID=A0A559L0N1_FUSOC|nr:Vegetative incompatibility protein HET-E-1 [Fusarium oxysporum f. sp. cubense]
MRLINTTTLELHEFLNENAPPYAILSHAWGDQEVTFQEWESRQKISWKHGYSKILKACNEALKYKLEWLWVDTNCIDKSSSAELSEAINSMFAYYQKSEVCFAYLVDVPTANQTEDVVHSQIEKSRWFTRGWTLQELIAPKHLSFHAADWTYIGRKDGPVSNLVSLVTQIDKIYLSLEASIHEASVAKRMSWLAKRTTTRTEDMAYCMLGIFDINMPLLYGEGKRAFFRLQEEIIKSSNDNTIFCWGWNEDVPNNWASLLAPWPTAFDGAGGFERLDDDNDVSAFSMSNAGLSIQLPTTAEVQYEPTNVTPYLAMLKAKGPHSLKAVCIRLAGRWVDTGQNILLEIAENVLCL